MDRELGLVWSGRPAAQAARPPDDAFFGEVMQSAQTRFAGLARWQACIALVLGLALLAGFILAALAPKKYTPRGQGGRDLQLYRAVVARVHAGENYYDAAGKELREQGYPTGSFFNWRPPAYAWLLGSLPSPVWAQVLLGLLGLVTLFWSSRLIYREGGAGKALAGAVFMLGALLWCLDGDAYFAQELWAGTLIALAIAAYGLGRWHWGVAAGLAALFLRELALPFCLLSFVFACWQRRRAEVVIWAVGLVLYGLFLMHHRTEVASHLTPGDRLPGSWIQFGGISFILATARMNEWIFALPLCMTALCLWLALLGFAGWRGPTATRVALTSVGYMAAFGVIGQPFNDYWGLLYTPLLPFGIVWAPAAVHDLYRAIVPLAPNSRSTEAVAADGITAAQPAYPTVE